MLSEYEIRTIHTAGTHPANKSPVREPRQYTPSWSEGEGYALFNLNGAYSTLEFDFGHEDGTDLEDGGNYYFYLDGKLVKTITPHPEDMVKHYKISLNNALQMKIVCDLHNSARYGFANAAIQ